MDVAPSLTPSTRRKKTLLLVLVAMTLLKILWAMTSLGSVDTVLFYTFSVGIHKFGFINLYGIDVRFNHTPLTAGFASLLYRASAKDPHTFACLLRLFCVVADITVVAGLLRWRAKLGNRPVWWALILFAASPVSLMISGFHGNVDPIMVAVLFFAVVAAAHEKPILCGLLFGLASNVKIVPIVLAPVFLFFWLARSGAWRFAVSSGAVMLAGWSWPLLMCPKEYLHNVFGYGSMWGVWGITYLLHLTGAADLQTIDFKELTATQNVIAAALKGVIIAGIAAVGWLRRKAAPSEFAVTIGIAWLVFFVFAPGVGVQYIVWAAPFLLLFSARSYTVITAASSVFLFAFYHSTSEDGFPWDFANPRGPETPLWSAWGTLAWLSFCGVLAVHLWQHRHGASWRNPTGSEVAGAVPCMGGVPATEV